MKLVIDNRTPYLNDYYFQTLCLLYFPGEKFKEGFESENYARFYLEETQKNCFTARVTLGSGNLSAEGSFSGAYTPSIPMNDDFYAMNALGKAFLEAGEKLFGFGLPWGYRYLCRKQKTAPLFLLVSRQRALRRLRGYT